MSERPSYFLRTLTILTLAIALSVPTFAGDIVSNIQVISLNGQSTQTALEQVVFSTISTKVGQELSLPQLSKDVAALVKTAGIENAMTRVDSLPDGTRQVLFLVSLRPRLQEIAFRGRNSISERKLRALVKSKVGEVLDERQIAADRKAIINKYEDSGYRGTAVTHEIEMLENTDGARLTFVIIEQPRYKLKGVAFEGNTIFTDAELQDAILTKRAWWRYIFRMGNWYNAQLQSMDISRIVALYGTKGYLDAQVTSVETRHEENNPLWVTPVYHIEEGVCYSLRNVTISGNENFSSEDLLRRRQLKSGQVFDTSLAERDLDAMKAPYQNHGYLDLVFNAKLTKDAANGVVDVDYQVSEGSVSRISQIIISGNTYTADRVIRREMAIFEDDLADARKIQLSKNRLENLGYFSQVDILPKTTENPDRRDLAVQVTEKPTGSISLGAAFSTEDSVMGTLELTEANFSLQKLLRMEKPKGDGQRMRAYIALGADTSAVNLSLTEPSLFDSPFSLTNEVFLNTRFEDDYDERHVGYGLTLSLPVAFNVPFLPSHTEYWKLALGLRIEHIRISNLDDEEKFDPKDESTWPDEWDYPEGRVYALQEDEGGKFANRIILSMNRDTRNHTVFPTRGSRVDLDVEYVTRALGSYADYIKLHAGAQLYLPVYEDIFLRLSADADTVEHISGDPVRVFDRYFAGGFGTIRGFKRHYVSPVNGNENSIGGSTLLVGTAEFIKPIKNFMFFKVFCDVGNVWWDSFDADLGDLNASIGVGIQFKALPLRLDYGYPIVTQNKHLDDASGRFHFSITTSF
ncbi:MAG: outer membrane protein assembly factor BamA [Victivallales bacterium]|nr:outer membrane protein assembly factor BamA [Victivallales bacterium]